LSLIDCQSKYFAREPTRRFPADRGDKENTMGSLQFYANFLDVPGAPPQACRGESHPDTLGIRVFPTLSTPFANEDMIVVLESLPAFITSKFRCSVPRNASSEIYDGEVRGFARSVISLAETLIRETCGSIPVRRRRPSGGFRQCACGNLELHPPTRPGTDPRTVAHES
jgi:hypothetical protein